jgi:hypothetical protein
MKYERTLVRLAAAYAKGNWRTRAKSRRIAERLIASRGGSIALQAYVWSEWIKLAHSNAECLAPVAAWNPSAKKLAHHSTAQFNIETIQMNAIETPRLKRISKAKARKLWGKADMSLCPAKLMPDGGWRPNMDVFAKEIATMQSSEYEHERYSANFDHYVQNFEWYNCQHNETGTYTAFYLIKSKWKHSITTANPSHSTLHSQPWRKTKSAGMQQITSKPLAHANGMHFSQRQTVKCA